MASSNKLVWDETGKHFYETGVKNCVLYPYSDAGYGDGVAWNGVTAVNESPSGAEPNNLYADDQKYLTLTSAEDFGLTIEAYTYPDEFAECDGSASVIAGVTIGQQARKSFGFSYKTTYGNDTDGNDYGYKIHLVYGCKASPSSKDYATINDSPDAITLSWEISTTPMAAFTYNGVIYKPTATCVIDSKTVGAENMKKIEDALYGSETAKPKLLTPAEIVALISSSI